MEPVKLTVDDVVNKLTCNKTDAYNLLKALVAFGFATEAGSFRVPGSRGKGKTLYSLDPKLLSDYSIYNDMMERLILSGHNETEDDEKQEVDQLLNEWRETAETEEF